MFGFNVGVLVSYAEVCRLIKLGAQAYPVQKTYFLDIIPAEEETIDVYKDEENNPNVYAVPLTREVPTELFAENPQYSHIANEVPTEIIPEKPIQTPSPHPVLSAENPPDLSGMTLKGQAQAITAWVGGTRVPEERLTQAFGKAVVLKLISEGYLVRTKKGIVPGS